MFLTNKANYKSPRQILDRFDQKKNNRLRKIMSLSIFVKSIPKANYLVKSNDDENVCSSLWQDLWA